MQKTVWVGLAQIKDYLDKQVEGGVIMGSRRQGLKCKIVIAIPEHLQGRSKGLLVVKVDQKIPLRSVKHRRVWRRTREGRRLVEEFPELGLRI
jgi:hypothetical protein